MRSDADPGQRRQRRGDDVASRVDDGHADEGAAAGDIPGDQRRPLRRVRRTRAPASPRANRSADIAGDEVRRLERSADDIARRRSTGWRSGGRHRRSPVAARSRSGLDHDRPDADDEQQAEAPDQLPMSRRDGAGWAISACGWAIAERHSAPLMAGCRVGCNRDRNEMTATKYAPQMMSGFGSHFATEAVAGALPKGRNSPQRPAFGLYAEQFRAPPSPRRGPKIDAPGCTGCGRARLTRPTGATRVPSCSRRERRTIRCRRTGCAGTRSQCPSPAPTSSTASSP